MFRIGLPEILVILIAVMIFVNPKEFPGFFRKLGKFIQQMKEMRDTFKQSLEEVKATINTAAADPNPAGADRDVGENHGNKGSSPPTPGSQN